MMQKRMFPILFSGGILATVILWATGGQKPPVQPAPAPPPAQPAPSDLVSQLLAAHNNYRAQYGAAPLTIDARLTNSAQKHAQWMRTNNNLSHTGAGGSSFADRIRAEGYNFRAGGENIAAGYQSTTAVMTGWMNSPGHKANIISPNYTSVGFGISGNYWCADFATPLSGNGIVEPIIELPGGTTVP